MKLCFTNEKAIEAWFERVTKCGPNDPSLDVYSANKRILGLGHALCSYGDHFVMARWFPEQRVFLLNTRNRRSASTSKHQSYVRLHVPERAIEVGSLIDSSPVRSCEKFLQRWDHQIHYALDKSTRAWRHKGWWISQVEKYIRERNLFIEVFKVPAMPLPEDVTAALVTLKLAA